MTNSHSNLLRWHEHPHSEKEITVQREEMLLKLLTKAKGDWNLGVSGFQVLTLSGTMVTSLQGYNGVFLVSPLVLDGPLHLLDLGQIQLAHSNELKKRQDSACSSRTEPVPQILTHEPGCFCAFTLPSLEVLLPFRCIESFLKWMN